MKEKVKYLLVAFFVSMALSSCGVFHDPLVQIDHAQLLAFSTNVRPILSSKCFSCHAGGAQGASAAFFMNSLDETSLYSESYRRITAGTPSTSILLSKGMGNNSHGGGALLSASDQTAIENWISSFRSSRSSNLFLNTVRPILANTCFNCHSNSANAAFRAFEMNSTDNVLLYTKVFEKVVPGQPLNSSLIIKGSNLANNHGGGTVLTPSEQNTLATWINSSEVRTPPSSSGTVGTGGTGGTGGLNLRTTSALSVPTGLTLTSDRYLRFPLNNLGHSGAFVEVGMRLLTAGVYQFSQWRVYSPNYALTVRGITVIVKNGSSQGLANTLASLTFEIPKSVATDSNTTPLPAKIYANEGVAQMLFIGADEVCETSYRDRGGKYQGQVGVTLPKA